MALIVNTNQSSLTAQRFLNGNNSGLTTAFERLASGQRINRAADDAAGLVISSNLSSQIGGLEQATRNANDAISLAQVTEGAIEEVFNSLQRMRVLTIQSGNGINSAEQLAALQQEFDQSLAAIDNIANNTKFGGLTLLDGSAGVKYFLIGANAGQSAELALTTRFNTDATGFDLQGLRYDTDSTEDILNAIDAAINTSDAVRAELGAAQNSLASTMKNLSNIVENVSASRSRIRDTDYAKETTELTRTQILQQSSITVLTQANQRPQAALQILS